MNPQPVNRRQALAFLGSGIGAAALAACGGSGEREPRASAPATPPAPPSSSGITPARFEGAASCKATIEQIEGPYFIDVEKIRSDIREDREGTPLRIAARVVDADGCTPIPDAVFEIWHCDAEGRYSGFEAASNRANGRPSGGPAANSMDDKRYLRGAQVTDSNGIAVITTIYPGWYIGRSVHVHAKVALSNAELLVTQFYFDDASTDQVHKAAVYTTKSGKRTSNDDDGFYRPDLELSVSKEDESYLGLITIGVQA